MFQTSLERTVRLIERLKNLHDGPRVLPDVIRLGDAAVPALEAILRGPSQAVPHSRCFAADALGAIGTPSSTAALVAALHDSIGRNPDPVSLEAEGVVVDRIAEHLGIRSTPEAAEALLEALHRRPYPGCARSLGRLRESRAIPLLIECLNDDGARPAAIEALRRFGRAAGESLCRMLTQTRLAAGLESPSRIDGRAGAVRLLGELADQGLAPAQAALVLRDALYDRQRKVRLEGALALARRGGDAAEKACATLALALDEPDWVRAEEIARALVGVGSPAEEIVIALISAAPMDESGRRRRLRAVAVAGQLRASSATAPLAALARAPDPKLRLAAVTALAQIPSVAPGNFAPFVRDPVAIVRRWAVKALLKQQALDIDRAALLLGDSDRGVRELAHVRLRECGAAALPVLKRILRSFGSPLRGLRSRARLWCHACASLIQAWRTTPQRMR